MDDARPRQAEAGEAPFSPLAGSPDRFINRELSWLAFNERVLEEASNAAHPLLERLRFVSISAANLDEFYMVRVAGLKSLIQAGVAARSADGLTPQEQLRAVNERARKLMREQQRCWRALREALREEGIEVLEPEALDDAERACLAAYFVKEIFPALTPVAIDPAHPFPFIPNFGFSLVLSMKRKDEETSA
ncbi:MAG: RNA degradosome polyphosphate kinase, partial [Defluviicoccus sp.]|nr:RNA degradosome polyphosphate kinase [Defluviicoccus sp.]